jgi:hypothetical protein
LEWQEKDRKGVVSVVQNIQKILKKNAEELFRWFGLTRQDKTSEAGSCKDVDGQASDSDSDEVSVLDNVSYSSMNKKHTITRRHRHAHTIPNNYVIHLKSLEP